MDQEKNTESVAEPDSSQLSPAKAAMVDEKQRVFPRRRVITLLASVAAGVLAVRFWSRGSESTSSTNGKRRDKPRFKRRKTPALAAQSKLATGFYWRNPFDPHKRSKRVGGESKAAIPVSNTIHYIDSSQRALFLDNFGNSRIQQANDDTLALKVPGTRVHLGRASAIFEIAALDEVAKQNYGKACQLLVDGIKHDLAFKRRVRGLPSLRLYDLLARIAAGTDDQAHLKELLTLANDSLVLVDGHNPIRRAARQKAGGKQSERPPRKAKLPKEILAARIAKWSDPNSEWKKKMTDPKQTLSWKISIAPETTLGKSVMKEFAIKRSEATNARTPAA